VKAARPLVVGAAAAIAFLGAYAAAHGANNRNKPAAGPSIAPMSVRAAPIVVPAATRAIPALAPAPAPARRARRAASRPARPAPASSSSPRPSAPSNGRGGGGGSIIEG
jgi:hypothetical protein